MDTKKKIEYARIKREHKLKEYLLDFTGITTKEELHAYLKAQLQLPEYYGNNLDALYDCLTGMPLSIVTIVNLEALSSLEMYALSLMEVFEAAAGVNEDLLINIIGPGECVHDCESCSLNCSGKSEETVGISADAEKVVRSFDDKKILIWGYGREGKSTEQFLKDFCNPASVDILEGKREEIDENKYDLIIKSPGIIMEEDNPKYTSQTEIFLKAYRDNVIGITGTKGKSTTSSMLAHVLEECSKRKVILLGNIGEPCLNYFGEIEKDTIVVFEMSCHQLAHTKISPHIAVLLNLYEEHLDYYGTVEKYHAAKINILKYQTEKDHAYVSDQVCEQTDNQVPFFTTEASKHIVYRMNTPEYELKVLGAHNRVNASFVEAVASEQFGIDRSAIRESMKTFGGLSHRLENIGTYDGIDFYDDSISTIPSATISALEAVKNAYSVIIGGLDRGIDYSILIDYVGEHPDYCYIFAYESGKRIYDCVMEKFSDRNCTDWCFFVEDLEAAVKFAKEKTPRGKACIMSPAAASYGYFKNFEHRGAAFVGYVKGNDK